MPGVMDDADVGADALGRQCHVLEVVRAREGQIARRRLARSDPGRTLCVWPCQKIALEPQAVVPPIILAPLDQVWRSVEAVGVQGHPRPGRQPSAHRVEQVLLHGKAYGAVGFLDAPSHWQGALAPSHAQHQNLVALRHLALIEHQRDRIAVSAKRARISLANGCITASQDTRSLARKRAIH